jgi:3-deoxy-7-phosphoheptulonate synthase
VAAIVSTRGNHDCHLILRGGSSGPNFDPASLERVGVALGRAGLPDRVVIDCSHANSGKDPARQEEVCRAVGGQIAGGNHSVVGLMLESFIEDGRQDVRPGQDLVYGRSITDACMSWKRTEPLLAELAGAVRVRRRGRGEE